MKRQELLARLKPYSQGAFSGQVADWPQLKPLLRDLYSYLEQDTQLVGIVRELLYNTTTIHLDMGGDHRYVLGHRAHPFVTKLKQWMFENDGGY